MAREMCYRCFWPQPLCWCPSLLPLETRTRFVFLMHPKEFKQEKAGTGRLTQLCLPHSSLHMGIAFDGDAGVSEILADPRYFPVLLYPGRNTLNLSHAFTAAGGPTAEFAAFRDALAGRTLLVVILDATWSGARKMLKLSSGLQRLPRLMFTPASLSRYVIKRQPQDGCLSTLEAVHELLTVLERVGLDTYQDPGRLLAIFQRMQDFQLRCAADPARTGYRRRAYKDPGERRPLEGRSHSRRENYLNLGPARP
jgi:DTW domain-containing protein YfiP